MGFTRMFIGLITIVLITLAYSCERGEDSIVEDETAGVKSLTGTWELNSSDGDSGPLHLRQFGKDIIGRFKGSNNPDMTFSVSGTISGDKISLEFSFHEYGSEEIAKFIAKFDGKVSGNKMSGKWVYEDQSGTWEAIKK